MYKLLFITVLLAALIFIPGCFLLEGLEESAEIAKLSNFTPIQEYSKNFEAPAEKIACVDFSVDSSFKKINENWFEVTVSKKLTLNGKDMSSDYLKLLDNERKTAVESMFLDVVKDAQNLFKDDIVYINPKEFYVYTDASGTRTVEGDLKDASFDKIDWARMFSKILSCYNYESLPENVCRSMGINEFHDYIVQNKIKNIACIENLEKDPEIQSKLKEWQLLEKYQDEKAKLEFRNKFFSPFKDNCFRDSACEEKEVCHLFRCKNLLCAVDYKIQDHKCIYSPFEKYPSKAKYVYLFVPLGNWQSDEEWENMVLSRADFMADIYPVSACKNKVSVVAVPPSWANKKCKISDVRVFDGSMCPNVFDISTCGKGYAKSVGINKIERIVGLSSGKCEGGTQGYAYFHFDTAYAQKSIGEDRLEQPAHEVAHTYKICDEYKYKFWERQNKEIKCPNKFPEYCDKESDCFGNKADIVYSNHFEAPGNKCKEKELYSVMGSMASDRQCGSDKDMFNAIEKQISCS